MKSEPLGMRRQHCQRRCAAGMGNPGTGVDRTGDLTDCGIRDAQKHELRITIDNLMTSFDEPRRHRSANASAPDNANGGEHEKQCIGQTSALSFCKVLLGSPGFYWVLRGFMHRLARTS